MSASNPPPKIACPHCQALIKSPALPAGSSVNCPKCGQAFRIGQEPAGQKPGAGGQGPGVRSQEPGAKVREPGPRSQPPGGQASQPRQPQPAARPQASVPQTQAAPPAAAAKPAHPRPVAIDADFVAKSLEQSGRSGVAA